MLLHNSWLYLLYRENKASALLHTVPPQESGQISDSFHHVGPCDFSPYLKPVSSPCSETGLLLLPPSSPLPSVSLTWLFCSALPGALPAASVSPVSVTRTQNLPLTLWSPLVISDTPLSQKTLQMSRSLIFLTFCWEFNPSQGRFCIHHLIETASRSLSPMDAFQELWVWCPRSGLPLAGHSSENSFLLTFVNSPTLSFSVFGCHSSFIFFACFFCIITSLKCCFVSKLCIGHLLSNIAAKWSHPSSKF